MPSARNRFVLKFTHRRLYLVSTHEHLGVRFPFCTVSLPELEPKSDRWRRGYRWMDGGALNRGQRCGVTMKRPYMNSYWLNYVDRSSNQPITVVKPNHQSRKYKHNISFSYTCRECSGDVSLRVVRLSLGVK